MQTMTVTSLGFFDIDITSRVVEYIKGYDLDIDEAELPTGDHELLVAIQDIAGYPNAADNIFFEIRIFTFIFKIIKCKIECELK